jgi:hypothetical protein
MIFHASIPAEEPARVARVVAELWDSEYFPFVYPGSFVVLGGDDRGSLIEVLPRGLMHTPGPQESQMVAGSPSRDYSELHLNIATPLSLPAIEEIAAREKWLVRVCDRLAFNVIEFWLENRIMLELMTPAEVLRYQKFTTIENWRALSAGGPSPEVRSKWGRTS